MAITFACSLKEVEGKKNNNNIKKVTRGVIWVLAFFFTGDSAYLVSGADCVLWQKEKLRKK